MKFKSTAIALAMGLFGTAAMASDYNVEAGIAYADEEGFDVIGIQGTYYFESVDLSGTAWAEAAFMGRNSSASVSYIDVDSFGDIAGVSAQFFGDKTNNLYAAISYANLDTAIGSDSVVAGEVGYFLGDNWLVSIATSDADGAPIEFKTKYVGELDGGTFFNIEASIDDESKDLTIDTDYYITNASSIGLTLSQAEGFDYGINVRHFFNKQVSFEVNHVATDFGDETGIALVARF